MILRIQILAGRWIHTFKAIRLTKLSSHTNASVVILSSGGSGNIV